MDIDDSEEYIDDRFYNDGDEGGAKVELKLFYWYTMIIVLRYIKTEHIKVELIGNKFWPRICTILLVPRKNYS